MDRNETISSAASEQRIEGEGNVTADRRYREATREFVEEGKVEEAAEKAVDMNKKETAESDKAEIVSEARKRA